VRVRPEARPRATRLTWAAGGGLPPGGLPGPYPGTSAHGTPEDLSPPPVETLPTTAAKDRSLAHIFTEGQRDPACLVRRRRRRPRPGPPGLRGGRILRGKHRPYFAPHVDTGDHVVVVNADKVVLTSGKADDKLAYRHSGYPGGLARPATPSCWRSRPTS
jgi:hypothetical protein